MGKDKMKDKDKVAAEEEIDEIESETQNEAEGEVTPAEDDRIKAAEDKADEYLLAAQRIQADFENYKRRNKSAIADATEDGINETVKQFLPLLDNVARAVEAANAFGDESFCKGIDMLQRQVNDIFEKLDVCEIETETFDPNFHNAVMQEEKTEDMEENKITQVFQKGYMRKGKVLRFSMVKVAK